MTRRPAVVHWDRHNHGAIHTLIKPTHQPSNQALNQLTNKKTIHPSIHVEQRDEEARKGKQRESATPTYYGILYIIYLWVLIPTVPKEILQVSTQHGLIS